MSDTKSEKARHRYTNDIAFGLLLCSYMGVWVWLYWTGAEVPVLMDLGAVLAFLTAVVWGFGSQAAEVAKDLLGRGQ